MKILIFCNLPKLLGCEITSYCRGLGGGAPIGCGESLPARAYRFHVPKSRWTTFQAGRPLYRNVMVYERLEKLL